MRVAFRSADVAIGAACAAAFSTATLATSSLYAQDAAVERQIQELVSAYARSELSVNSTSPSDLPRAANIVVKQLSREVRTGSLLRGTILAAAHEHGYVLLHLDDALIKGGGFPDPDMSAAAAAFAAGPVSDLTVLARDLAVFGDPNGAFGVVFEAEAFNVEDQIARGVRRAWDSRKSVAWPEHGVSRGTDSLVEVSITSLSRLSPDPEGRLWQPVGYHFVFTARGSLRGWSRRIGEAFSVSP